MCFSATASFAASGVLIAIGATSLILARKTPRKLLYAAIPLLFGVQQFFEGLQWQAVNNGNWSPHFGYAFLFFAFLIWPVLIPLASTALEKNPHCRNIIQFFGAVGTGISLYLIACLVTYPLSVEVVGHSLHYNIFLPLQLTTAITYIAVICGALIFSSRHRVQAFGYAILTSAIISYLMWSFAFISIWCFFSAVLSLIVILEITSHDSPPARNQKPQQKLRQTSRSR